MAGPPPESPFPRKACVLSFCRLPSLSAIRVGQCVATTGQQKPNVYNYSTCMPLAFWVPQGSFLESSSQGRRQTPCPYRHFRTAQRVPERSKHPTNSLNRLSTDYHKTSFKDSLPKQLLRYAIKGENLDGLKKSVFHLIPFYYPQKAPNRPRNWRYEKTLATPSAFHAPQWQPLSTMSKRLRRSLEGLQRDNNRMRILSLKSQVGFHLSISPPSNLALQES